MTENLTSVVGLAEIAGVVILSIIYVKSRIPKETIEQQSKLIDTLNTRITAMENDNKEQLKKHLENEKAIADLQGQIKVYKEIPLQDISKSLKVLENLPLEFKKISEENAKNIVEAVGYIRKQHVEHQTVDTETVTHKE